MSRAWRLWWPLYVLLAPLILVALAYAVAVGAHSWRWCDGCLTFIAGTRKDGSTRLWFRPRGQCWSPVVGFASEAERDRADLRVHEFVHVAQAEIGVLAGLAIFPPVLVAMSWPLWLAPASAWVVFPIVYGGGFAWRFPGALRRNWSHAQRWAFAFDEAYRTSWCERHAYGIQERYFQMPPSKQTQLWGHRR